jgi:uncharacterized membrane protein YoaK (UPF0700 family)
MKDVTPTRETPLPRWLPATLSFVAGYVDSYTFLALFGLFVAQVTGSFVTAGAELVTHDVGIAGKMIAILAFVVAAALTAGLIGWLRDQNRDALPWMLALETLLIATFCVLMLSGPPETSVADWHGILAGLFAAMAMGSQSVIVRLLMRGIPQTNVMTGNMTQIGIETMELWLARRRHTGNPADARLANEYHNVRQRLGVVLSITIGFVTGAACGAVGWAKIGLPGASVAVLLVGALTVWALRRDRS